MHTLQTFNGRVFMNVLVKQEMQDSYLLQDISNYARPASTCYLWNRHQIQL